MSPNQGHVSYTYGDNRQTNGGKIEEAITGQPLIAQQAADNDIRRGEQSRHAAQDGSKSQGH